MGAPVVPQTAGTQDEVRPKNPEQGIMAQLELMKKRGTSPATQQVQFFQHEVTGQLTALVGAGSGWNDAVVDVMATGGQRNYSSQSAFEEQHANMVPVGFEVGREGLFPRGRPVDGKTAQAIFATPPGSEQRKQLISDFQISGDLAGVLLHPERPICRIPDGSPNLASPGGEQPLEPNGPGNTYRTPPQTPPVKCF